MINQQNAPNREAIYTSYIGLKALGYDHLNYRSIFRTRVKDWLQGGNYRNQAIHKNSMEGTSAEDLVKLAHPNPSQRLRNNRLADIPKPGLARGQGQEKELDE